MQPSQDTLLEQKTSMRASSAVALPPVLQVEKSVLGKRWSFVPLNERQVEAISQMFQLPEVVSRILVARGILFDQVEAFLNPALKTQLPDPYILKDMDKAAKRIADAIMAKEKVAVLGDYDVDGATSTALLKRYFRALGQDILVYIPDRLKEGYGPNETAFAKLKSDGAKTVITVDCGATAFDPLAAAAGMGLDVIVLDHHRGDVMLPKSFAVVNPNRLDDNSGLGQLAAVGVVFMTLVALNRELRQRGFFKDALAEPRILQWLDLVALGTVCDIVPLTGINRAFVAQGLRVMALRQNPGLVALAEVASLSEQPNTFHAGFVFGPRVNAGGRVGESSLGVRILSTDDPLEAKSLAIKLHEYNAERKSIEDGVLQEALAKAEAAAPDDFVLIVAGEGWHPGVIGIVAARLKEKYNRPVCVVAFDENGIGKASCRSVPGVDLGGAIISAKQQGLLINGGGHKMAAGFTVARDLLENLCQHVNQHVANQLNGAPYAPELRVDAVLSVAGLTLELTDKLSLLAPYGAGHSEPRFALAGVKVVMPKVVGDNHVSCFLQDTSGGTSVKAIAFRALDSKLGETLLKAGSAPLNLVGHVTVNTWQGRTNVNFQIVDASPIWQRG